MSETVLWEEDLRGGQTWSQVLEKGMALRITDIEGGANVAALFYNAANPAERYNMPDTLKAQHIAKLTKGFVLYSDMGRILCSITDDTVGWHDPIGGTLNTAQLKAKYGERTYQEARNDWFQSPKDSIILELAKYELSARDLTPSLNLFSKIQVNDKGEMQYIAGNSKMGDFIELRAEMKVLVILCANHHPKEPGTTYNPKPMTLTVKQVAPPAPDDPCRISRPENGRGFILTERYTA